MAYLKLTYLVKVKEKEEINSQNHESPHKKQLNKLDRCFSFAHTGCTPSMILLFARLASSISSSGSLSGLTID